MPKERDQKYQNLKLYTHVNDQSSDYFQVWGLALTTTLYMACWQFGQFALFSQMCCLFPIYAIGLMSKDTFNIILNGQLVRTN